MLTALFGCTGTGMFTAGTALFLTRSVDLSPGQASVALSAAGGCAIAGNAVLSHYVDRVDPRRGMIALCAIRAVLYLALACADNFPVAVVLLCCTLTADLVNQPMKQVLMLAVFDDDAERRASFALQRSMINVAFAGGALIAGVVVAAGSPLSLRGLVIANALLFLPMIVAYARLPRTDRVAAELEGAAEPAPDRRASPWRDGRYLVFAVLSALLTVRYVILFFALPLWVTDHTAAPTEFLGIAWVLNTVTTAVTQARWGRVIVGLDRGGVALAATGVALAAACGAFYLAGSVGAIAASALLLVGALVLSAAEAVHSTAEWELSVALAPPTAQGHYYGMNMGLGALNELVGPLLVAGLVLPQPALGWTVVAGLFLVAGAGGRLAVLAPRPRLEPA